MKKILTVIVGVICLFSFLYGGKVANTTLVTTANVTTVNAEVAAANNSRKFTIIANYSDSDMWIGLGQDAAVSASYFLGDGEILKITQDDLNYLGEIDVLCVSDNKQITVIEGF